MNFKLSNNVLIRIEQFFRIVMWNENICFPTKFTKLIPVKKGTMEVWPEIYNTFFHKCKYVEMNYFLMSSAVPEKPIFIKASIIERPGVKFERLNCGYVGCLKF